MALDKARLVDRLRHVAAEREHEARHDFLTDLPNRRAFLDAVTHLAAEGRTGAVLFLDLDDFKDVNDTLGHEAGDALLQRTGDRLREACPGMVARLGGDEFAVLLPGVSAGRGAPPGARPPHRCGTPSLLGLLHHGLQGQHRSGAAPGRRRRHQRSPSPSRRGDVRAKSSGTGVEMYRPQDGRAVARRLVLAADLPAAIEQHHFTLAYQPQAGAATGAILGVEALLRWQHPTYGSIPPPEMVALAERVGDLRRLTDAVLLEALRQRAAWASSGFELTISVNITPVDLRDERLPETVARLLETTATPASALTLEITEQGVMQDPDRCLAVLDRLAELGVQLSVDDFGTGYSSLAYLERLPVNEVKIDKSFVQRLDQEASEDTVVRSTVTLAHDLGMQVVAEGLESRAAWGRLARLGVEVVQGYILARPMPPEELLPWLRDHAPQAGDVLRAVSGPAA